VEAARHLGSGLFFSTVLKLPRATATCWRMTEEETACAHRSLNLIALVPTIRSGRFGATETAPNSRKREGTSLFVTDTQEGHLMTAPVKIDQPSKYWDRLLRQAHALR